MTPLIQKLVSGAAAGFVAALLVDVQAWKKYPGASFNWGLAVQRWISGALSGALAALGMGQFADVPVGGASDA